VYGLPAQWPHLRELYERAGFVHDGHVEIVLLARVDELPRPSAPPLSGLAVERSVGESGTRLTARRGEESVGFIEVETNLAEGGRLAHLGFCELTRTARGWHHRSAPGASPEADATPGPRSAGRP
jgi:hypothetical protein